MIRPNQAYLNLVQTCEYLGISCSTGEKIWPSWERYGVIPARFPKRTLRFKKTDLDKMIEVCKVVVVFLCVLFASPSCRADEVKIDMARIAQIESSGNPLAWRKADDSRGLYQITPIVLKEWNNLHPEKRYYMNDLWNPKINFKIADWYMSKRIPQMLRHFKLADTVENRLVCYNAGISFLVNKKALPKVTRLYLKKYFTLARGRLIACRKPNA